MSKRASRQIDKRIDHKKERAATRAAIDGARPRQPQGQHWSSPIEPVPIIDDSIMQPGHKSRGQRCSKAKDGIHVATIVYEYRGMGEWRHAYPRIVCKLCGKRRWWHKRFRR